MDEVNGFDEIDELKEFQRAQDLLNDISDSINASTNIQSVIESTKEQIVSLFRVEAVHIYAVDTSKKDMYTFCYDGNTSKELRLPISKETIPGYVAASRKSVTIADAYDKDELSTIDRELSFDTDSDIKTGFCTRQVMAAPILHNNNLMGVIQIINKTDPSAEFSEEEPVMLHDIAEALGKAFHKHRKKTPPGRGGKKFGYLINQDLISEEELEKAKRESLANREPLETILIKKYNISKDDIRKSLEEYYKCRFIAFNRNISIPDYLFANLEKSLLLRNLWMPFEEVEGYLHVLTDDPHNKRKRASIESTLNTKALKYDVALPEDIIKFINLAYKEEVAERAEITAGEKERHEEEFLESEAAGQESEEELMKLVDGGEATDEQDQLSRELESKVIAESLHMAQKTAVKETVSVETENEIIQLVNRIIGEAHTKGASDIHVEPDPEAGRVGIRYRIDGACINHLTIPYSYSAALISRIKIMSNLDITVRRTPQDGKIKTKGSDGKIIELRVATVPTTGNLEDVVMRILTSGKLIPLEAMGLTKRNYNELLKICEKPYGIILVVGPTGSGKTTTLHAALRHINMPDRKIWTAEDPVEITQRGLRQVQVNPKVGFGFAAAMRAFLRSDPDVIMVGEMRDYETSKIAVEASLTGHLVFSTLHTNSAPETITRLLDIGIDPFNFSDSLLGVLAQRLVRTLCKKCKEAYHPSPEEYKEIVNSYGKKLFDKLNLPDRKDLTLYHPKGCDACGNSGYKGRLGIHELLIATDTIKRLIVKRESIETIRENAIREGMRTLLQDGILKSIIGLTDVRQVLRTCIK